MIRAICSGCRPCSARPSRSAFSAAHVLGPQSISVTGPSVNTYTLAGPTLNGVGTTTRWKNSGPDGTAPMVAAGLCRGAALALASGDESAGGLVMPAVRGKVVDRKTGLEGGMRAGL